MIGLVAIALAFGAGDLAAFDGGACARVTSIDENPGGIAWAWLELGTVPPVNVRRVPLDALRPCATVLARRPIVERCERAPLGLVEPIPWLRAVPAGAN